mgnify:CR=1 FL=1
MNKHQQKVLLGTAALITLMTLYPPVIKYNIFDGNLRNYDWIFTTTMSVNIGLLLIQIFVTLFVGGVLHLVLDNRNNK